MEGVLFIYAIFFFPNVVEKTTQMVKNGGNRRWATPSGAIGSNSSCALLP